MDPEFFRRMGIDLDEPLPADAREENTAEDRYYDRISRFQRDGRPYPRVRHHLHWLFHNCVAHPLLAVFPGELTVDVHDLSSKWLNQLKVMPRSPLPGIPERSAWLLHNVVAHVAIGLFPCPSTFAFHDRTAEQQNVDGWV